MGARLASMSLALMLAACASSTSHGGDGGPIDMRDGIGGTAGCLPGNGWVAEQVTASSSTATYDGDLAFTASGDLWMAFSDPTPEDISDQDIFATHLQSCAWSMPEARNMASTHQFAYPSLVATGETVHLAMSGLLDASTQNNDIYYAKQENGTWTSAANLTSVAAGNGLGDYSPVLAASASGDVSVAYLFAGTTSSKPPEVHVAKIVAGALQGDMLAIPSVPGGCDNPQLVYDASGTRHVVAVCGDELYYSNDSGGSWATATLVDTTTGMYNTYASLALDPFGTALHLAWRRDVPCGASSCGEILYSKRTGAAWSTPKHVNNDSPERENTPTMTVAPDGTIYIAYERDNADNKSDIFVASSSDGSTFTEVAVTPGTDTTSETLPTSMTIDPTTMKPHFTYSQVTSATPFNMEVWHAALATGGSN